MDSRESQESASKGTITDLLQAWHGGDRAGLEGLMARVYNDLRRIAAVALRKDRQLTVQPSDLVNEYFIRLLDAKEIDWESRNQFFAIACNVMRRILVDQARRRARKKRGGSLTPVTFDDGIGQVAPIEIDLLALDEALGRLEEKSQRQAKVVELRFFGGMTIEEAAGVLEVAQATVKLDWNMARAWLRKELS